jgi:hypothetical protein
MLGAIRRNEIMKRKLIGAAALLMTSGVANADDVDDMYKAMTYPMLAQFRWGAPHDGASAPKHVIIAALSDRPIPLIGAARRAFL